MLWIRSQGPGSSDLVDVRVRGQPVYGAGPRQVCLNPPQWDSSLQDLGHLGHHSQEDVVIDLVPRPPFQPPARVPLGRLEYRDIVHTHPVGFSDQVSIPLDSKLVEFESIFLRDSCRCSSSVRRHMTEQGAKLPNKRRSCRCLRSSGRNPAVQWRGRRRHSMGERRGRLVYGT